MFFQANPLATPLPPDLDQTSNVSKLTLEISDRSLNLQAAVRSRDKTISREARRHTYIGRRSEISSEKRNREICPEVFAHGTHLGRRFGPSLERYQSHVLEDRSSTFQNSVSFHFPQQRERERENSTLVKIRLSELKFPLT